MDIHPTAIIDPCAELDEHVTIHAYCIVGSHVKIGSGTVVGPHAFIDGRTTIGARNQIGSFCAIGGPPQDLSYRGEETQVIIGDDNIIRENVTIHRGTIRGDGATTVGSGNFLMAYAHVAHDCKVGDHVVMANAATLGGHVRVEDHATIGGLVAVHQFVRVGVYGFIGGKSGIRMDLPPYMLAVGYPAKLYGPNLIGLRRSGFPSKVINAIKKAYRIIFRSGLSLKDAIDKVRQEVDPAPEIETLLKFMMEQSKRGITRQTTHDEQF